LKKSSVILKAIKKYAKSRNCGTLKRIRKNCGDFENSGNLEKLEKYAKFREMWNNYGKGKI